MIFLTNIWLYITIWKAFAMRFIFVISRFRYFPIRHYFTIQTLVIYFLAFSFALNSWFLCSCGKKFVTAKAWIRPLKLFRRRWEMCHSIAWTLSEMWMHSNRGLEELKSCWQQRGGAGAVIAAISRACNGSGPHVNINIWTSSWLTMTNRPAEVHYSWWKDSPAHVSVWQSSALCNMNYFGYILGFYRLCHVSYVWWRGEGGGDAITYNLVEIGLLRLLFKDANKKRMNS